MDRKVAELKEYMTDSKNTAAVTGSGISYLYGMGRLKQQTNRMELMHRLTPEYAKSNPESFYAMMKDAFLDATFQMGPGPVHRQLAELEQKGLLQGIVTQNMDCLHTIAGSKNVVEFQGSFNDNICVDCGSQYHDYTLWNHGELPRCPKCGGPLMPLNFCRTAPAQQNEFQRRMDRAADMLAQAELVIIIGTSGFLSENYMSRLNPNAKLVQINPSRTKFDHMVHLNIRQDAEKVFDEILREV